ncbi:MAG TPA: hypothetical protein VFL29_01335 [Candidatus Dormibacteraeota bacterium]|nr:hypothetical protein [Candidatus Dormibacteraeota bacterium]
MQNQMHRQSTVGGGAGLGLLLIAAGLVFLVARLLPFDIGQYGWPLFIVMFGLAFLLIGMTTSASGFVVPGSIATVVGLILAVQNTFDLWASWSYAWALVFPFSIGVGTALLGMRSDRPDQVRTGTGMAGTGIALFLVFGAFFEGILHVDGFEIGSVGDLLIALILIGSGVLLLILRMASNRSVHALPPAPRTPGDGGPA